MELTNWITSQHIDLMMAAESELETIASMVELVRQSAAVRNVDALAQNILDHEIMSPSASGCCAVVFRALHPSAVKPALFFGRFDKGIGYYSKSGHPIDLIFLIVAPPDKEDEFNVMLQKIERAVIKTAFREKLRATTNPMQVIEILIEELA